MVVIINLVIPISGIMTDNYKGLLRNLSDCAGCKNVNGAICSLTPEGGTTGTTATTALMNCVNQTTRGNMNTFSLSPEGDWCQSLETQGTEDGTSRNYSFYEPYICLLYTSDAADE